MSNIILIFVDDIQYNEDIIGYQKIVSIECVSMSQSYPIYIEIHCRYT
jgi:hypothetical protein